MATEFTTMITASEAQSLKNTEALEVLDSLVRGSALKGGTTAKASFYTVKTKMDELLTEVQGLGYVASYRKNKVIPDYLVPNTEDNDYYTLFLDWSTTP